MIKIKPPRKPARRERFRVWWDLDGSVDCTLFVCVTLAVLVIWGTIVAWNAGWFDKTHLGSGRVIGKSRNIEYIITVQNGNTLESWALTKEQWDAIIEGETVTWGEFHEDKAAEETAESGVDADSTETPGLLPDGEKPQGVGQ